MSRIRKKNELIARPIGLATLLIAGLMTFACRQDPPPTPPDFCSAKKKSSSAPTGSYGLLPYQDKTPTWDDDILPLLDSNTTGRIYKCTTCHSVYKNYETVANQAKFDAIMSSVKSGYMPLKNDDESTTRLSEQDLALLEKWAAAGFPKTAADVTSPSEGPGGPGGESPVSGGEKPAPLDDEDVTDRWDEDSSFTSKRKSADARGC